MKSLDANDLLLDGKLPTDPREGTVRVASEGEVDSPAPVVVPWRTPAQVLAAAREHPYEWLLPRILYFGSIALVIGGPKVAGKSTLALGLAASALKGEDLFGRALPCGPVDVVLLTEEADVDLAAKLTAFGIADGASMSILSRSLVTPRPAWAVAIRWATEKCLSSKRRAALFIDTFYRWACFAGDDASKSGEIIRALEALEEAKRAGVCVIPLHHPAKGAAEAGRVGGMAGLGSVSLAGETEVNLELRAGNRDNPNHRVLHVESRATGVFDVLVTLVRGDGAGKPDRWEEVGDLAEVKQQDTDARIVAFVVAHPGSTGKEIEDGAGVNVAVVQKSLPRLRGEGGRLDATGTGKAGNPRRYWPKGGAPADSDAVSLRSLPSPSKGDFSGAERMSPSAPSAPSLREGRDGGRRSKGTGGGRDRSPSGGDGGRDTQRAEPECRDNVLPLSGPGSTAEEARP